MKLHLFLTFLIVLGSLFGAPAVAQNLAYQDGDLIFHESQSEQSKAIREATDSRWSHVGILFQDHERSRWYVAEGAQPVRLFSLSQFIARGKDRHYRVYRQPGLTEAHRKQLRAEVMKFIDKDYDIYFEWSDDLIYCSELVYKSFLSAVGTEIGRLQKFHELKLDGPYAKELIRLRETEGHPLKLDEPIVTPASQINDSDLMLIEKTD